MTTIDDIYESALNEIETGQQYPGLWTKAFKIAEGDVNRQKAEYIRLRVEEAGNKGLVPKAPITSSTPIKAQGKKDLVSLSNGLFSLAVGAVLVVIGLNGPPFFVFLGGPFVIAGVLIIGLHM